MTLRQSFTKYLFDTLSNYDYVLLKHIETSVFDIKAESDLDILLRKKDLSKVLKTLKSFDGIVKVKVAKKHSMSQLFIQFKDETFLQLDFLYYFIRKNIIYLNTEQVFQNRVKNHEGIYVTSEEDLFDHVILFNFLNFAGIKKKYVKHFGAVSKEKQTHLLSYINQKYGTTIPSIESLGQFDGKFRNKILNKTAQMPENGTFSKLLHTVRYILDQSKETVAKKGITITFSGVDGAGKSTILFKTEALLKEKYRQKVVMLRHRPQILPILSSYKYGKQEAEKRAAETMPRTGGNKSSIGSLIRFAYYYLDYLFGQFYIYFKYNLRGYIVLYDRYYFDFIVDHRRSNINIPSWIPKFLYTFVFKPDLNFFLYAPPEVILKRKQELNAESIVTLTKGYKGLFEGWDKNGKRYIPIKNIVLEETMATIEGRIKAKM